jgi:glycosyltransferase involved in cell wall biosynthesis
MQQVVVIGDSLSGPGGISSVVRTYRDTGFFEKRGVRYLSNFEGPGVLLQLKVMLHLIVTLIQLRFRDAVDLLHIHSASRGSFWRAAIVAELASIAKVPYLLHIHSGEFPEFFKVDCGPVRKAWVRRVLRKAAGVICLTPGWQQQIQQISTQAKTMVLPNPVVAPDETAPAATSGPINLLFLGRLIEKKGLLDLFQALALVLKRFPDLQLRIGGDGDMQQTKEAARRCGVENAVKFEGWVSGREKDRLIAQATLFVLPSHYEAFPVSILEAMVHGKPVVATAVGGIPEILIDGRHGLLVPPKDPQALAEALMLLLADPERMHRLGMAGRRHAIQNYSASHVTQMLGNYYDDILCTL